MKKQIEYPKKMIFPLFLVIDNSGSMAQRNGYPIRKLNKAIEVIIHKLYEINQRDGLYEIRIAIMLFNDFVSWHTDGLVSPDSIAWEDIDANGMTVWGSALFALDKALSRNSLLSGSIPYGRPGIVFITDGSPSDDAERGIACISKNKWYRYSCKAAIALEAEYMVPFLERITEDNNTVYFFYKDEPFDEFLIHLCLTIVENKHLRPIVEPMPYDAKSLKHIDDSSLFQDCIGSNDNYFDDDEW